jgi:nicotinamidase-related amidase
MATSALVIIDVQVWVAETAWNADAVIANLVTAIAKARAAGAPVIFVQHNVPGDPVEGAGAPGWALDPRLQPLPDDPVIEKRWRDPFAETTLHAELDARGVTHLVIGGMDSELCVRSALYRAIAEGYDITFLEDAHTTSDRTLPGGRIVAARDIAEHATETIRTLRHPGRAVNVVPVAALDFAADLTYPDPR